MFNASILELQSQIHYYQEQQELAEQELDRLKMTQAFAEDAAEKVEEALEHIEPKYLDVFREHLLSMFPTEAPIYLEEKLEEDDIEYMDDSHPDYKSIEQLQEEEPDTVVAVFHSEEHLKDQGIEPKKTYFELTGRPDLKPDTYEDLTPNITYSSSGRAYVGFNDRKEAEKFQETLSEPSMISDAEIMNNHKFELKFYADLDYVKELVEEESNNFEEINSRVIYNHNDRIAYLGMTAKGRCDYYGQYLTDQLTVGEKYTYSDKPSIINGDEYKYELRITEIELDDAVHLATFNLQRDPEHPDNAKLLTDWRANKVRELPPAYTPSPKPTPISDLKIGEIVSRGPHDKQYKVLGTQELQGTLHAEVICTYNSEMPALVNQKSYLKEVYRVLADDIQYDDNFQDEELDFPPGPYSPIDIANTELADIITTSPNSRSGYEVIKVAKGYVDATCLYNIALPKRVGETFTFSEIYLVERADTAKYPNIAA